MKYNDEEIVGVDHVTNTLVINVLHTSTVGMGFIPTLPAAGKNQGRYPAATDGLYDQPGKGIINAQMDYCKTRW